MDERWVTRTRRDTRAHAERWRVRIVAFVVDGLFVAYAAWRGYRDSLRPHGIGALEVIILAIVPVVIVPAVMFFLVILWSAIRAPFLQRDEARTLVKADAGIDPIASEVSWLKSTRISKTNVTLYDLIQGLGTSAAERFGVYEISVVLTEHRAMLSHSDISASITGPLVLHNLVSLIRMPSSSPSNSATYEYEFTDQGRSVLRRVLRA